MITKGALADVLAVCSTVETPADGSTVDLATAEVGGIDTRFASLSGDGYRVLGVADAGPAGAQRPAAVADEAGMTFVGLLTFLDPPKPDVADDARRSSRPPGISVRMITGDNRLVAAHVAQAVGLRRTTVLTGADLTAMCDADLAYAARHTAVFAEIAADPEGTDHPGVPRRRARSSATWATASTTRRRSTRPTSASPSTRRVDVAKEAAAIVLLDKDLRVLLDGVREGRRTFANTMKYVCATRSASFGNVLSMAIASVVLPFLPLLASQILLHQLPDGPARRRRSRRTTSTRSSSDARGAWDIRFVRDFMIVFGVDQHRLRHR